MFDRSNYKENFGSTSKADGVSINRSYCCVQVSFDVAGFTKEQIALDVASDGIVTVRANNGNEQKNYSILVGDVEVPEKMVRLNDGLLSVTFAKAKRRLTVK